MMLNKNKYRINLFIALLFILSAYGSNIQAYTMDELMESAVKNRYLIKRYESGVAKSKNNVTISLSDFIPNLKAHYEAANDDLEDKAHYEAANDDLEGSEKTSNFAVTSTLNLFSGFGNYHTLKSNLILKNVSKLYLKQAKQDIQLQTAQGMIDVYRKISYKKVVENALKLYSDRLEIITLKYETGLLTKRDVLEVKVEMDNAEQEKRKAATDVRKSLNILQVVTCVVDISETNLRFDEIKIPSFEKDQKTLEDQLFSQRSEIQILKKLKTSYERKHKASKSKYYPSVSLSSSYERSNKKSYDAFDEDGVFKASVLVEMDLFNGMKTRATVKNSYQDILQAEYDLIELKILMKIKLKNILLDFEVAEKNLKVAEASVEEATENQRITQLAFNHGKATTTDILTEWCIKGSEINYLV